MTDPSDASSGPAGGGRRDSEVPANRFDRIGTDHPDEIERLLERLVRDTGLDGADAGRLETIFLDVLAECADPDRAVAALGRFIEAQGGELALVSLWLDRPAVLEWLVRVLAVSQALGDLLIRRPGYYAALCEPGALDHRWERAELEAELRGPFEAVRTAEGRLAAVRRFERRHALWIGVAEIEQRVTPAQAVEQLSAVADVCLRFVLRYAEEIVTERWGPLEPAPGSSPGLAVIGMGKLGGSELNYSSDVDLLFVYEGEGRTTGGSRRQRLSAHEYFNRIAAEMVRVLPERTDDGWLYRVDTRLRPEGDAGPLAVPLSACDAYYGERADTWERLALTKARFCAGDPEVGRGFEELAAGYAYSPLGLERLVEDVGRIKRKIERELLRGEDLRRNIKLGRGGIREIEFIVQSLIVLHGATNRALRTRSTVEGLHRLAEAGVLDGETAARLEDAYWFLRRVEHRLQIDHEVQTHTVPPPGPERLRLAKGLGFRSETAFEETLASRCAVVRAAYERILVPPDADVSPLARMVLEKNEKVLAVWLRDRGMGDGARAAEAILSMAHGSGSEHVSRRTTERFLDLLPTLLEMAGELGDPARALAGLGRFVERYGARSAILDLLARHQPIARALLDLFDRSRALTDIAIRRPELVETLFLESGLGERKPAAQFRGELRRLLAGAETVDDAMETARRYRAEEYLRIGLSDILGIGESPAISSEFSDLADACFLEAGRWLARIAPAEKRLPELDDVAVIALGKAGGREVGYGADLDVVFAADCDAEAMHGRIRAVARWIDFMGTPTAAGRLFKVDARLRPFGEDGPLVTRIDAFERYHRERAQLWERQALVKARILRAEPETADRLESLLEDLAYGRGFTREDLEEIRAMRLRIERERVRKGEEERAFKTGAGGLIDIEFLVQAVQLRYGGDEPGLRIPRTLDALDAAGSFGFLPAEVASELVDHYVFLRGLEGAVRIEEDSPVSELPRAPGRLLAAARTMGFRTAGELTGELAARRRRVREIYDSSMESLASSLKAS